MHADQIVNLVEAVLWSTIGLVLLARIPFRPAARGLLAVAGVAFLLFGLSDVIESALGPGIGRGRCWC